MYFARTNLVGEPADLVAEIVAAERRWQRRAEALDATGAFPHAELDDLYRAGAFVAPLPVALDGAGFGTEPGGAHGLLALLRAIGRGNPAVGRLFEGHVNALQLIVRYGDQRQVCRAAEDAAAGHLFAIWNTEASDGVRLAADGSLSGKKIFCSAAGEATRALITVRPTGTDGAEEAPRMMVVALERGERVGAEQFRLQGMRACVTASMDFTGMRATEDDVVGAPGDYLRQPVFSAGAWRTSAVTVGGLDALLREACRQLAARQRDADPHQRARIGEALIARETAAMWVERAAMMAESGVAADEDITATVNLARIAIEAACLDAMRLVQRSVGLAGLIQGNTLERMMRDLATYLRQPAPDETLVEAAGHFMGRELRDGGQHA